jgi:hypothetical protein
MSAYCSEVLSASTDSPGVKFLRIIERVEGFILQRSDERGGHLGDEQFDTLDEAMAHVYSEYEEISDWRFCPDDADAPTDRPGF